MRRYLLAVIVFSSFASAQVAPMQSAGQTQSVLPNAPSAVAQQANAQKSELLADDPYVSLSAKEKFHAWLRKTYDPSTFFAAGMDVALSNLSSSMRYCCGGDAWGMQYGAGLADAETRYFFGTFLFPTLTHQDPRYLPKHSGSVFSRAWYAATRVVVTRKDDGESTFNSSEFLGIAFSKALSNAYYPERQRTWGHTTNDILGALEGDASGNVLTEFTPDIKRIFRRHTPKRLLAVGDRIAAYKPIHQN